MKKKILFTAFAIIVAIGISGLMSEKKDISHASGAPAGVTGSPGDGNNCSTMCHGGTVSNVTGWITSTVPGSGYVPGQTYSVTGILTGSGAKGFEISPQSYSGALLGTLIAGTNNHLVGSGKYVTHSNSQSSYTFQWTAPVAGTGDVTFYGAFVITQPVIKLCTLVVQENTVGINEIADASLSFYPNSAKNNLTVNYSVISNSKVEINLYSMDGKLIASLLKKNEQAGNHTAQISLNNYISKGAYMVELKVADKSLFKKLLLNN